MSTQAGTPADWPAPSAPTLTQTPPLSCTRRDARAHTHSQQGCTHVAPCLQPTDRAWAAVAGPLCKQRDRGPGALPEEGGSRQRPRPSLGRKGNGNSEKGPSSPLQHPEPKLGPCSHPAPRASPSVPRPHARAIPSLSPGGLRFPQDRPQEEWPGHSGPAPVELDWFGPAQHLRSISGCLRRQAPHPCVRASPQPSALCVLPVAPQPSGSSQRCSGTSERGQLHSYGTSPSLATEDIVQGPLLGHARTVAFVARDTVWGVF